MPGTVDDFMNRFGGGGTIDDSEAMCIKGPFGNDHYYGPVQISRNADVTLF
jgi:hypothetical protein